MRVVLPVLFLLITGVAGLRNGLREYPEAATGGQRFERRRRMTLWLAVLLSTIGGRSDAQIRFSPPGVVVVNVVSRDLSPVPGAVVSLQRAESPEAEPVKSMPSGAGGHAEFRDVAAGSYFVKVSLSGFLEMRFGPIPVEDKTPPSVRIPEILCVLNPVMKF
jgi:hypothetical protein